MNGEFDRGGPADGNLETRLERRFTVELAQAERDYPGLRSGREVPVGRPARGGRAGFTWPRLAMPGVAVTVLAVIALVYVASVTRPEAGPAVPLGGPGTVIGSDGILDRVDGQRVYRVADVASFPTSGSFLLGGYAATYPIPCPSQASAEPSGAEADLVGYCNGTVLQSGKGNPTMNGLISASALYVAPVTIGLLAGWFDGPAIVARVHTHDPAAVQCGADQRALCEAALVVEAVVWPYVPTEFAGQRVYRAADMSSFPTSGSFLLGGRFTNPSAEPACAPSVSATDDQFVANCSVLRIDRVALSPLSSVDEPNNEIVVARVHVRAHEQLASQCPADAASNCEGGIVVEEVVWRSDALILAAASASPERSDGLVVENTAVSFPQATGFGFGITIGPDGIPTDFNGETVYRAANLPTASTFLLGGVLGRDAGCAAPTEDTPKPPACGYLTVDGLAVGTMYPIDFVAIGSMVVVRIERSKTVGTCTGGPCRTTEILVVTEVLIFSTPSVEWGLPPQAPSEVPTPAESAAPSAP